MVSLTLQENNGTSSESRSVLRSDEEEIKKFSSIQIVIGNSTNESQGDLIVSTKRVLWIPNENRVGNTNAQNWSEDFKEINMHAISADSSNDYSPCIYTQVGENGLEVRFVPVECNDNILKEIYDAMCTAAELNVSDEEMGDEAFSSVLNPSSVGEMIPEDSNAMLTRLDNLLQVPEDLAQNSEGSGREQEDNDEKSAET